MDDERITFDLNEYLKQYLNDPSSVPCDNADPEILGSETLESFTKDQVDRIIDPIVDAIAESPEAISRAYAFDSIQCFLK